MKNYYILVHGAIQNSGDFYIGYRAKQLLEKIRPDRNFIEYDRRKSLNCENLELFNNASAILLTGGPAIRFGMFPNVYKLCQNLDNIKSPIITFGLGWKDPSGSWQKTRHYAFDLNTIKLLKKIEKSGYVSSVRDFHTLNVLNHHGFRSFKMTGCPGYYSLDHVNKPFYPPQKINKVVVSPGVTMLYSKNMENQFFALLEAINKGVKNVDLQIALHHSPNNDRSLHDYLKKNKIGCYYNNLQKKLEKMGFKVIDISGCKNKMIDLYTKADIHIGYRVHAHIFMNSISKPSILLSEDSRGKGVKGFIPWTTILAYGDYKKRGHSIATKAPIMAKNIIENYAGTDRTVCESLFLLEEEMKSNFHYCKICRKVIDVQYGMMVDFLKGLP